MPIEDFLQLLSLSENKLKIESFMKKRNSIIWNNFFKDEAFSKSDSKEKNETLSMKSENLSQNNEQNESFSLEEQIFYRKTSSFENLKYSFDQILGLNKNEVSEGKNRFFGLNFDFEYKAQIVSSVFLEKKENAMQNYFLYLKFKHQNKKKSLAFFLKHFKSGQIAQIYEISDKFISKSKRISFKFCLNQQKKIDYLPYIENRRKAQNFKLKKSKETKKKEPLQLMKNRIQRTFDSASKIVDNSIENSSNNDSFFINTEEDENSIMNIEMEKKNVIERKDAEELFSEEIKAKFSTLMRLNEKIEHFFVVSLLKKTELFLSFLILTMKRVYIFININNNKEKQGEIDKMLIIRKGFIENLKDIIVDLNHYKVEIMRKEELAEIHIRRYLLQVSAMELFFNKKTFFLICGKENIDAVNRAFQQFLHIKSKKLIKSNTLMYFSLLNNNFKHQNLANLLKKRKFQILDSQDVLKILLPLWEEGKISNFAYLMILNILSGRTYNDLSQYPVFPWILCYNEESMVLDFNDEKNYRNLSKPMGALIEEKAKSVKEHYYNIMNTLDTAPFHYGSHYSNPVVILYYLIRLMPFSEWAKDLQGGKFDLGDRIFNNICYTWNLSMTYDCKELIPELFSLPELFFNLNEFDFGLTQGKIKVNDVILPKWAYQNARYFINSNRKALESNYAHNHLNEWIDLIFGYKQQGDHAIDAINVFYPLTYENAINLDEINDINERNGILDQISEYGQTPKQLFKKPHPEKKKNKKIKFLLHNPLALKGLKGNLLINWNENSLSKEKIFKYNDFCIKLECEHEYFENMKGLSSFISKKGAKMTMKEVQNNTNLTVKGCNFYGNFTKFINFDNCYQMMLIFENKTHEMKYLKFWSFSDEIPTSLIVSNGKKHLIYGDRFGTIKVFKLSKKHKIKNQPANFYDLNLIKLSKSLHKEKKEERNEIFSYKFNGLSFEPNISIISEKSGKKTQTKIEAKKQDFEIRFEQKKNAKFHFSKFHSSDSFKKHFKFNSFSNLKHELTHAKRDFINFYEVISSNFLKKHKEISVNEHKKDSRSLEFVQTLNCHTAKITSLEICYSFSVLISCDIEGIVCLWSIEKPKLLQKIYSYHFQERKIFKEICFFESKEFREIQDKESKIHKKIVVREKIKGISICQENGDFLIFSKNYISIYSINGVLISILNRGFEKLPKFSAALLATNKDTFEENYMISGHKDGKIFFWIMKPTQILDFESSTQNIYEDLYSKYNDQAVFLRKVLVPYKMIKIHFCGTFRKDLNYMMEEEKKENEGNGKNSKKIVKIALSNNQKRMYTLNSNSEVYQWEINRENKMEKEENQINANESVCFMCKQFYGIFDRKQCIACYNLMCEKCAGRYEIFFYERSLRKKEKVCEQCFLKRMDKKIIGLYDNY